MNRVALGVLLPMLMAAILVAALLPSAAGAIAVGLLAGVVVLLVYIAGVLNDILKALRGWENRERRYGS